MRRDQSASGAGPGHAARGDRRPPARRPALPEAITGAKRPLTETDRTALKSALKARLETNSTLVPAFVRNYTGAVLHMWTSYVTERMKDADEESEWPEWAKLLSFVVRSSLLALFPEEALVEEVGHGLAKILEKDFEYTLEQAGEGVGGTQREKRVRHRKHDLVAQADTLSDEVGKVLDEVMQPLAEGTYYSSWLETAPLAALSKFRLPPLAPDLTKDQIEVMVAEQMAGFAHTQRYGRIAPGQQNVIELTLRADVLGHISGGHPKFHGAEAFAEEIVGTPISAVPHVPLRIVLSGGPDPQHLVSYVLGYAAEIVTAFSMYPKSTEAIEISRYPDGSVSPNYVGMNPGADLGVHLALAQIADPEFDPDAFVADHVKALHTASVPGGTAAPVRQLHDDLVPLVLEGVRQLMVDFVGPLVVE
jgi:hypothetical protein